MTLNLIPWWAYAAAGAMAGALLAGGIQQARVSSAQTGLAQVREQHAQAVADAALAKAAAHASALEIERELTARTQALQATIDKQDQDARNAQAQHDQDRRTAAAAAGRLREQARTLADSVLASHRVASGDAAALAEERQAAAAAARVLADVLASVDDRAGALAAAADASRAAGSACERAYDAGRAALNLR